MGGTESFSIYAQAHGDAIGHLTIVRLDIFGSFMASGFRGGDCGHRYSGPWEIGVFAFLGSFSVQFGGEHLVASLEHKQIQKTSVLKWLETWKSMQSTTYIYVYIYIFYTIRWMCGRPMCFLITLAKGLGTPWDWTTNLSPQSQETRNSLPLLMDLILGRRCVMETAFNKFHPFCPTDC